MNTHSLNLLKYAAFGGGIFYGYTHLQSLTTAVNKRNLLNNQQHENDLVEEAKISFDTYKTTELAKLAKKDGSNNYSLVQTVDPESIYYSADVLANWAVSKFGQ